MASKKKTRFSPNSTPPGIEATTSAREGRRLSTSSAPAINRTPSQSLQNEKTTAGSGRSLGMVLAKDQPATGPSTPATPSLVARRPGRRRTTDTPSIVAAAERALL